MVQQPFGEVLDVQTKNYESMDRPLVAQLRMMTRVLLASPGRMSILLLAGALVVVIGATAFSQIRLNAWNQPFYDALVHIGRSEAGDHFFTRVLHLIKDPHGRTFAPRGRAPAVEGRALGTALP
jgi:ABC-type uncharacterized transport system fused permease/ATPase subunit